MKKMSDATLGIHLLEVEVTTRCNLHCSHCYNREEGIKDLPWREVKKIINFCQEEKVDTIVFTGGEAFLYPAFPKLVEYLSLLRREKKTIAQNSFTDKWNFSAEYAL